ncbi:hypothetical protein KSS94_12245 [Pseudomonas fakonensis]|uniref:Uncharacterized protein n=1 Tax=Pseudomonas fakonensis TaxID=2842355 RepID=A0ABX8NBV9_9PSED|nr:hypothetical protein [Pseudomonas fakonensis]QXH53836.1 hypothetical protein KSS94_12245 [Pseudomonas fakonensis]
MSSPVDAGGRGWFGILDNLRPFIWVGVDYRLSGSPLLTAQSFRKLSESCRGGANWTSVKLHGWVAIEQAKSVETHGGQLPVDDTLVVAIGHLRFVRFTNGHS